jgi:hypothetical protein
MGRRESPCVGASGEGEHDKDKYGDNIANCCETPSRVSLLLQVSLRVSVRLSAEISSDLVPRLQLIQSTFVPQIVQASAKMIVPRDVNYC